jgi:hypothetical protein
MFAATSGLFHQLLPHLLQLHPYAAVVHGAADSRDHPADERWIDLGAQLHRLAGEAAQSLLKARHLFRRQRRRGRDGGANDLSMRQQSFAIDVEQDRQQLQPAPLSQQRHQLGDRRLHTGTLRERLRDVHSNRLRRPAAGNETPQLRVLRDGVDHRREIALDRCRIGLLHRNVEQCLGVSRG